MKFSKRLRVVPLQVKDMIVSYKVVLFRAIRVVPWLIFCQSSRREKDFLCGIFIVSFQLDIILIKKYLIKSKKTNKIHYVKRCYYEKN